MFRIVIRDHWAIAAVALALAAATVTAGILPIEIAGAQTDVSGGSTGTGGEVVVEHQSPGSGSGSGGSGGRRKSCRYYELASDGAASPWSFGTGAPVTGPVEVEIQVWAICTWTDSGQSAGPPTLTTLVPRNPREVALELVERARQQLVLPLPDPSTNPTSGSIVVNIETWLWLDTAEQLTTSASGWGVTATLTAVPDRTVWRLGDGHSLTCAGAGTPYDPTRPEQRSDCAHTYTDVVGPRTLEVSQVWRLRWSATNGQAGDIGEVVRQAAVDAEIRELETVLRRR
jgi:hypothetical protein